VAGIVDPHGDELALIDRAVAGDRHAARTIYDAHVMAVHRLASRMLGPDMADECTQDAFVRAFARLGTFRRQAALRTWLHSITVSVALNHQRSAKRRAGHVSIDAVPDIGHDSPESDPLLSRRIGAAIDGLVEELRSVVILNLVEGHTHIEIGEILGIPEGTSKARLSRARAQLREALADLAPATA
jgi:RNA polymerase sigma-70 factor (ECF subfamily)